jgi:hypothetical protein
MFRDPNRPKLIRGAVLQVLYLHAMGTESPLNVADPYAMPRGVLVRALEYSHILPARPELNAAVRYLQEKGYVRAEWDENGEFRVVRLTEKGIDLVEGSIRDAGVLLPR